MPRFFFAFVLVLCAALMAGAQQPSSDEDQPDPRPQQDPVITDPAEYEAYMAAIKIGDPERMQEALEAFLQRFPNTVMKDKIQDVSLSLMVYIDNKRNERVRAQIRFLEQQAADAKAAFMRKPDNLSHYTQCDFSPFKVEELIERGPFIRKVRTSETLWDIEVLRGLSLRIAHEKVPFIRFTAERLRVYPNEKHTLIESIRFLSSNLDPEMEAAEQWPSTMHGFEVYGINRTNLQGDVLGSYMLFRDEDDTVVTLDLLNASTGSAKFQTIEEYRALRDQFLKAYTACAGRPAGVLPKTGGNSSAAAAAPK